LSGGAGSHGRPVVGLGDAKGDDERRDSMPGEHGEGEQAGGPSVDGRSRFWDASRAHPCLDGKVRRIPVSVEAEPVFQRLVDGLPGKLDDMRPESGFPVCSKVEGRVMLLKGYGNAIVPQAAAEFVMAFDEAMRELTSR